MNLLRDTHAFLWFIDGAPQMSALARQSIEDTSNRKWLSIRRIW